MTFSAAGRTVTTNAATDYRKGTCGDVKNGRKLSVDGVLQPDGTVRATLIELGKKDD